VPESTGKGSGGEQASVASLVGSDRVLAVLSELARHPSGIGLDEMSRALGSPKPTVHRALAALRRAGFAIQNGRGRYLLGDEFIRLAFTNAEARPDHLRVQPILEELAERHGETAHYAVLDGRDVVYRSKVDPSTGAAKLTSTIGGRNPAHSTAVGKLLLSYHLADDSAVAEWVGKRELPARTGRTKTTAAALAEELAVIRRRGFSTDDQENEPGINCLAVPLFLASPSVPSGAVSISSLSYRTPLAALVDDLPAIRAIVDRRCEESRFMTTLETIPCT
jgi:IclR family transcriptional regulator, acetate operon repressor